MRLILEAWRAAIHRESMVSRYNSHNNGCQANRPFLIKMTSSNGSIFRVTGPLFGEFTSHRWIPLTKPVTRSFDGFCDLRLNKRLSKQSRRWWFVTQPCSLWRHCNGICLNSTFKSARWAWPGAVNTGFHDDVIKRKHFPRNWPFVRGIHRGPVNSPHKGQWGEALVFPLICVWINGWENNRGAGDFRRCRDHYDVIVMRRLFAFCVALLWPGYVGPASCRECLEIWQ